jgi:hypothetical protein
VGMDLLDGGVSAELTVKFCVVLAG